MSVRYPLVPVLCGHCRAVRMSVGIVHEHTCPVDHRNYAFFAHPDLVDLDVHLTGFYPEFDPES